MIRGNLKPKNPLVNKIICIVAAVVLAVCLTVIGINIYNSVKSKDQMSHLKDIYYSTTTATPPEPQILPQFDDLLKINKEVIGWIKVPGTKADLPVVHKTDAETGNSFYLTHDIYSKSSKSGTIFADYRDTITADSTSDNIVIYGHNQMDHTMFGELKKFKNISFYKQNPVFTFTTLYKEDKYKIIGYFVVNASEAPDKVFDYHNYINFTDEAQFNSFIKEVNDRSYMHNNVDVKYGDKLVTLSTCSGEFENGRLVIIGRKVRDGESDTVDISSVVTNPNIKRDPSWYKIYGKK